TPPLSRARSSRVAFALGLLVDDLRVHDLRVLGVLLAARRCAGGLLALAVDGGADLLAGQGNLLAGAADRLDVAAFERLLQPVQRLLGLVLDVLGDLVLVLGDDLLGLVDQRLGVVAGLRFLAALAVLLGVLLR